MRREVMWATIASGTSLSGEVNVGGGEIVGIQMPAGWDAAGISFAALTREDRTTLPVTTTFGKVQDAAGAEVTLTTPTLDTYVAMANGQRALIGLGRVKIRSGTAAAAVNQTAQRLVGVVVLISNE